MAYIWDAAHGMRKLSDVLTNNYGLNLGSMRLAGATGISDDGHTITGVAVDSVGAVCGFAAVIPEPGTLSLLAAGVLVMVRRRK
jgi:hypothetical protein